MHLSPGCIPILLTSSVIAYDAEVRLADQNKRLEFSLESLRQWKKRFPHQPIVVCDGSSFDFQPYVKKFLPYDNIECLFFENDQTRVAQHGRGYGEGEIVRYALQHSQRIQQAGCFAKCSSKLWVTNFEACAQAWQGELLLQGIFTGVFEPWQETVFSYIDTRFYISSIDAYQTFFQDAHLRIREKEGFGLENAFHQIFLENRLHRALSPVAPVICGVGGGIGTYYKNSLKRRLKEALRLRIVRSDPVFRPYFIDPLGTAHSNDGFSSAR